MMNNENNNHQKRRYKRFLPLLIGGILGVGLITWASLNVDKSDDADRDVSELFAAKQGAAGMSGTPEEEVHACFKPVSGLSEKDLAVARIAWVYYENNYQPKTGLVNSVNNYTSTTMWDTGSALAATIAAHDFGFIDQKQFDDRIVAMIKMLAEMKLFNNEAPNKVYNTLSGKMVDYRNQPSEEGIGVSTLDLARLIS